MSEKLSERQRDIRILEQKIRAEKTAGEKIVASWKTYKKTCTDDIVAILKKAKVYDQVAEIEARRNRREAEAQQELAPINARIAQLDATRKFLEEQDVEDKQRPLREGVGDGAPVEPA